MTASRAALARTAEVAGPRASVTAVRPLAGGTHARTYLVQTENPQRVGGVVDWSGAALGPRGFDLGWCRLDLYLLFDERISDVFRSAYERAIGFALPDRRLFDLWAVARSHSAVEGWVENYRGIGRPDLTASVLRRRHAAWTERLLETR